ncbi:hypothetical protein BAMTA208_07960 [Bacillus amyloliquefaciens TA208]|nr:hypothetical protein BAMTA208_07960 [Bacillus amyloliquefaciens TA208]
MAPLVFEIKADRTHFSNTAKDKRYMKERKK